MRYACPIGLGFTRRYLERECRVFGCARDWRPSTDAAGLQEQFGERFRPIDLDVTDEQAVTALPASLDGATLDIAINNAGALQDEAFGRWTAATFETALRVNCTGPALIAQALVPLMKAGSAMVNISSGLASNGLNINPETGLDAYAASKSALNMITRRLDAKLGPRGITVVAIDPGWVRTRMGGEEAELSVDESVSDVIGTIEGLGPEQGGLFLSRNGELLPW